MASRIATVAKKRLATLKEGGSEMFTGGAPSVSRTAVAGPPRSREGASAADAKQIRIRQQAERLDEGLSRRGPRKRTGGY